MISHELLEKIKAAQRIHSDPVFVASRLTADVEKICQFYGRTPDEILQAAYNKTGIPSETTLNENQPDEKYFTVCGRFFTKTELKDIEDPILSQALEIDLLKEAETSKGTTGFGNERRCNDLSY